MMNRNYIGDEAKQERLAIVESCNWNCNRAARLIGITVQGLRAWLAYNGIKRPGGPGKAGRPKTK